MGLHIYPLCLSYNFTVFLLLDLNMTDPVTYYILQNIWEKILLFS